MTTKNPNELFKKVGNKQSGVVGNMDDLLDMVKADPSQDQELHRFGFAAPKRAHTLFGMIVRAQGRKMNQVLTDLVLDYIEKHKHILTEIK